MKQLWLVIGVDCDGDAMWDLAISKADAVELATKQNDMAFEKPKVYEVHLETLAATERNW